MEDAGEAVLLPIIINVEEDFEDGFSIILNVVVAGGPVMGTKAAVAYNRQYLLLPVVLPI